MNPPPPSSPTPEGGSRGYAHYVLAVLFLVYVFNFIDRQVLSILIVPIQEELEVSDSAMGALVGLAFAAFYTLAGIPIARWADTGSRRNVILFALSVWSVMTAVSGLARSYVQLAAARIGVGIGEAGGTPPSHSLLSDYYPPERRATALALYGNGVYVGAGLGILAGGLLKEAFDWRTAFFVVGLAGLPLALLVRFTVRELPRGSADGEAPAEATQSLWEAVAYLFSRRSFVWLVVGACFGAISGYGILNWGATFLLRVHELTYAQTGTWLGLTIMVGGCMGVSSGGWLADRLGAGDARWYMRMPAVVSVAAVPFAVAFLLLDSPVAAMAAFVPFYMLSNMYVGPLWSTTQNLVRPDMRATASAILLFILNIVGLGLGPTMVGVLNDVLEPSYGAHAVRYSLLVTVSLGGVAGIFFWISSGHLRRELSARPKGR